MVDATQLQTRRRARWAVRAVAVLSAACMVLAGLLAVRHETAVAHVRGALTGELQHAHAIAERHEVSATPHLHGRTVDAHAERGACTLLAALDHPTIVTSAGSELAPAAATPLLAPVAFAAAPVARALLRLAPKTSPPAIG